MNFGFPTSHFTHGVDSGWQQHGNVCWIFGRFKYYVQSIAYNQ